MTKSVVVCLLTISSLFGFSTLSAAPVYDWSLGLGGPGTNTAHDVAVDGSGNVVVVGLFTGTMTIGGQVLTSAGAQDIFLAKYDATGAHLWCKRFGGTGNDVAKAVAINVAGDVILTGHFRGPVTFGGAPLAGRGLQDVFVAKFDAAGVHQWSQWYGSAGSDEGQDIVVDASGNVVVTGQYTGLINFGGGDTPAFGSLDMFVVKLNAAGGYLWSKGIGNVNPDVGNGVAVDALNNVFVTGMFTNTVNFGGSPLTSVGSNDVFVVKYDGDGVHQWSTRLGGPTGDAGQEIGVDASGDVVVTGIYNGAFLVKYDTDGVQEWSQSFSGTDVVQGMDLAISSAGTITITGNLRGTTDFGGGPLTSAGDDDIFLLMSEADGAHRWSQRFGNTGDDWGQACAFDASGNLIAGGIFSGAVDFGGGPLVSAGLADVYLAKFDDHVADTTPPNITCPAGVEVEQAAPDGTPATHVAIAAFLSGASALDDEDPAPAITDDAPDVFPAGMTTVTFRATDSAGNYAECAAMVVVVDTTPPQITCPAGVQVDQTTPDGTPATHPVIAAFLVGALASDAADLAPFITHNAPAVFPLGTTPVTFSVIDASGNQAQCTAAVTVIDPTAPQLTVVLDKTVLWPPDHNFVTVCAQVTVSDNGNGEATFWLVSITSNEAADKSGTGQTTPDIRGAEFGTPDLCFDLRAERAGDGSDRVYEIVYATRDASGNEGYGTAWVRVPHDKSAELTSARPNPFNPQTTLDYSLSVGDRVQIAIYDARGSLVRRLVDQDMPAGEHRVTWNGLDQAGRPVGSGIYFVKLAAGSAVDSRKIVLLK